MKRNNDYFYGMLICLLIQYVTRGLQEAVIKNNTVNVTIQNSLIPLVISTFYFPALFTQ